MVNAQKLVKADVAAEYATRFPKASTKTLARIAYRDNPSLWPSLESCRSAFRYIRGATGDKSRGLLRSRGTERELQKTGDPFGKIPKPITNAWHSFNIHGPVNALILGDIHVPYHDVKFIEVAVAHGKKYGSDLILLNGDIMDCYATSRWETDPRQRNFPRERDKTVELLKFIRQEFPKARIVYKLGNHEERYERYMMLKAPELLDMPEFSFDKLLGLASIGIECVRDKRPIMLGKLAVLHGHEYRFAIQNPVGPARGLYMRANVNALCNHFHRSNSYTKKSLDDKVITCWSVGCGCDLHPEYLPLNDWNLGFARVEIDKAGAFRVDNPRCVDGKAYE